MSAMPRLPTLLFPAFALLTQVAYADGEADAQTVAGNEKTELVLRWGQGGFRDGRSPLGELGGGQLAIDVKPAAWPVAVSISGEYYTNSPDPTHSYEISDLTALNILYTAPLSQFRKVDWFAGGGVGWLEVPRGEDRPHATVKGSHYDLEAGLHWKAFRRFGFYGVAKYLDAEKRQKGETVIDFHEFIGLVGVTFRHGF